MEEGKGREDGGGGRNWSRREKTGVVRMPPVILCSQTTTPPPTPFSPPTHAGMQAVTRCDLAVNELVLDTKVSM